MVLIVLNAACEFGHHNIMYNMKNGYQFWDPLMYHGYKTFSSPTVFNIDNTKKNSWGANPHLRMISGGSCDTEDWSNDADNSALQITRKN